MRMETKKVSSASLENKTHDFLLMGLVVALGFLFIAFEWSTTEVKKYEPVVETNWGDVDVMLPVTIQKPLTPPAPAVAAPPRVIAPTIVVVDKQDVPDVTLVIPDATTDDPIVATSTKVDEPDEAPIIFRSEVPPTFPGGQKAMMEYLMKNIKYPAVCLESGISGRVIVSFVVNTDGSIQDVVVLRGVHEKLDAEAIRVVSSMPAWTPGKNQGQNVRVRYQLPVFFKTLN